MKKKHSLALLFICLCSTRAEEMCVLMGEVSEKVNFIQDSLSELDSQLGQLQDLSALAMDTLTLLSASDSLHQEEARLAQLRSITASQHILPHSWTLRHRSGADYDVLNMRRPMAKSCKSTPPSLLKGFTLGESRRTSLECRVEARGSRGGKQEHAEDGEGGEKEVLTAFFSISSFCNNSCEVKGIMLPVLNLCWELLLLPDTVFCAVQQ